MKRLSHSRDLKWRPTRKSDSDDYKILMTWEMWSIQNISTTGFAQYPYLLLERSGWSQILCQDEYSFRTSATNSKSATQFYKDGKRNMTISVSSSLRTSLQSRTSCFREYLEELVPTVNVCDVHAVGRPTWAVRGGGRRELWDPGPLTSNSWAMCTWMQYHKWELRQFLCSVLRVWSDMDQIGSGCGVGWIGTEPRSRVCAKFYFCSITW